MDDNFNMNINEIHKTYILCPYCNLSFSSSIYDSHLETCNSMLTSYQCEVCGNEIYNDVNDEKYISHLLTFHLMDEINSKVKKIEVLTLLGLEGADNANKNEDIPGHTGSMFNLFGNKNDSNNSEGNFNNLACNNAYNNANFKKQKVEEVRVIQCKLCQNLVNNEAKAMEKHMINYHRSFNLKINPGPFFNLSDNKIDDTLLIQNCFASSGFVIKLESTFYKCDECEVVMEDNEIVKQYHTKFHTRVDDKVNSKWIGNLEILNLHCSLCNYDLGKILYIHPHFSFLKTESTSNNLILYLNDHLYGDNKAVKTNFTSNFTNGIWNNWNKNPSNNNSHQNLFFKPNNIATVGTNLFSNPFSNQNNYPSKSKPNNKKFGLFSNPYPNSYNANQDEEFLSEYYSEEEGIYIPISSDKTVNKKGKKTVSKKQINATVDKILKEWELYSSLSRKIDVQVDEDFKAKFSGKMFAYIDILSSKNHYFLKEKAGANANLLKRLNNEFKKLKDNLPCNFSSSYFIRADVNYPQFIKVLIAGSRGTPYEHGLFEYDIYLPSDYPYGVPKCQFMTTGNGKIRFNPNLYNCGKVCLSLLGTWSGSSVEKWDPKHSNLTQLLISLSSLVMSDRIIENEPGYSKSMNSESGLQENEGYANIVRVGNISFSMIEMIKHPSPIYEGLISDYFAFKAKELLLDLETWVSRMEYTKCSYTGLTSAHNMEWCNKLQGKGYETTLKKKIQDLKNVL